MKATSLSINIPAGCNARCPFCISKTTYKDAYDILEDKYEDKLKKALYYARYHNVDTVLITSPGEPTLHADLFPTYALAIKEAGIPIIELQTNGSLLEGPRLRLVELSFDLVSISIMHPNPTKNRILMGLKDNTVDYKTAIKNVVDNGMMCRVSANLSDGFNDIDFDVFVESLVSLGVHQLTLRTIGMPANPIKHYDISQWVSHHSISEEKMKSIDYTIRRHGTRLRTLPYEPDQWIYDYRGLSIVNTTCWTDTKPNTEIRSLIFQPDGGLYHTWNERGSRIL